MSIDNTPELLKASKNVTQTFNSIVTFCAYLSSQERSQLSDMIRDMSEEQMQAALEQKEKFYTRIACKTNFPKFRKLPPELRLRIWRFAAPGPRIIFLATRDQNEGAGNPKQFHYVHRTPAVLGACQESRTAFLTMAPESINGSSATMRHSKYSPLDFGFMDSPHMRLMFSSDIDQLFIQSREAIEMLNTIDILDKKFKPVMGLKRLKRLIIDIRDFTLFCNVKTNLLVKLFTGLKSLTLVHPFAEHTSENNRIKEEMTLCQRRNPTWRAPVVEITTLSRITSFEKFDLEDVPCLLQLYSAMR